VFIGWPETHISLGAIIPWLEKRKERGRISWSAQNDESSSDASAPFSILRD
jgi:hypothetical protein